MKLDWMLLRNEIAKTFNSIEWIPIKASKNAENGNIEKSGYRADFFSCGSIAFFSDKRDIANQLTWREIGCGHEVLPSIREDGRYSPVELFEVDSEVIGINLIFDNPHPVTGGRKWILNPDLMIALGLIKEGNCWIRPQENNICVVREAFDQHGDHTLIEIKKEFLLDYLVARKLSLRLYYCYQRAEHIETLVNSEYQGLESRVEERNDGEFEFLIRRLDDVFNGRYLAYQEMGQSADKIESTDSGFRVESVFRRDEWIEHNHLSICVRGDLST